MRIKRSVLTMVLTLLLLATFSVPVFAAENGTQANPYVGGHNFNSVDAGNILLHKLDIASFETNKANELIAVGTLSAGGTVTYTGNVPVGAALSNTDVVGTYVTSDTPGAKVNVTLGELAALGNITFHIEQVKLIAGGTPGSVTPDDYEPLTGGIDSYAVTDSTGLINWAGLPKGYYRVTEQVNDTASPVDSGRYIVSLPMVDPANPSQTINTVHMYPKNRANMGPVIVKEEPGAGDFNGNIVSWTIKSEIPASLKAAQGKQQYVITDTMSNGLTYAGNLKVYYLSGGQKVQLLENDDYSATATLGGTSLVVTLAGPGYAKLHAAMPSALDKDVSGRYVLYVTYDTVVNISEADLLANRDPENDVKLNFTNSDGTSYEDDPDPIILQGYASLRLTKKDGSDENILLPGAQFKVYTKLATGGTAVDESSVLKDATGAELVFTTDSNGKFLYSGLAAGNYYIVETVAPTGYKKLSNFTTVTISENDVLGNITKEVTVLNYRDNGISLPSTGGAGTMMFVLVGVVLISMAGIVFLASRRGGRSKSRR